MAARGVPLRGLSRKKRLALFVHRGLDRWLSPIGVWVFRRTNLAMALFCSIVTSLIAPLTGPDRVRASHPTL